METKIEITMKFAELIAKEYQNSTRNEAIEEAGFSIEKKLESLEFVIMQKD